MGPVAKQGGVVSESVAAARPLRADAARNRARILEAAEAVFASEGIEVPVDTIAEKAGVGVGTLYRHFPTKERLCEAILLERLASLARDARALAEAEPEDPAGAFYGFLTHVAEESMAKRDLIEAVLGAGVELEESAAPAKEELRAAVEVLLCRAQAAGAVRPDVGTTTVMTLMGATLHAAAHEGCASQDILGIVCDGLRAQGGDDRKQ